MTLSNNKTSEIIIFCVVFLFIIIWIIFVIYSYLSYHHNRRHIHLLENQTQNELGELDELENGLEDEIHTIKQK